jgi:hypothetical protein
MTTDDTDNFDIPLNEAFAVPLMSPLMAKWVNAELDGLSFDAVDAVIDKLLNSPTTNTTATNDEAAGGLSPVMASYYQAVEAQCPDFWPALVTQLKPAAAKRPWFNRLRMPVLGGAVAACVTLVVLSTVAFVNPRWFGPTPSAPVVANNTNVSPLPVSNTDPTLVASANLANQQTAALKTAEKSVIKPLLGTKHPKAHQKHPTAHNAGQTARQLIASVPAVSHSRYAVDRPAHVAQAILAEAHRSLAKRKPGQTSPTATAYAASQSASSTPSPDEYVFTVSANAEDNMALGFAE